MSIYSNKKQKTKDNYRKIYEDAYGNIPVDEYGRTYEIHHIDGNRQNNSLSNLIAVSIEEHYQIHYAQNDFAACLIISSRMEISPEEKSFLSKNTQLIRLSEGTHHFTDKDFIAKNVERQKSLFETNQHAFQRDDVKEKTREIVSKTQTKRMQDGTHSFLDPDIRERANTAIKMKNSELISQGKHIFQDKEFRKECLKQQFAQGRHPTQNSDLQRQKVMKRILNGTHNWIQEGYQTELNYKMLAEGKHASQKKKQCPHCEKIVDAMNFSRWHGDNCKKNPFKCR